MVCLVCFVYLVQRNPVAEPNQPDRRERPNRPDRPVRTKLRRMNEERRWVREKWLDCKRWKTPTTSGVAGWLSKTERDFCDGAIYQAKGKRLYAGDWRERETSETGPVRGPKFEVSVTPPTIPHSPFIIPTAVPCFTFHVHASRPRPFRALPLLPTDHLQLTTYPCS